jgi:NIMA (never in mitosis gene a)-related kinase
MNSDSHEEANGTKGDNLTLKKLFLVSKENHNIAKQEIDFLMKLNHQNLTKCIECITQENYFCLVMEHLEGKNLKLFISEQIHPLEEQFILHLFLQMISALKYIHDNNIFHQSIRAENIILTNNYQIKFINFGISKLFKEQKSLTLKESKIISFLSPEVIQGQKPTFASDIWSLGIVIYELMYLKHPFAHQNAHELSRKICNEDPEFPQAFSNKLRNVVQIMLSKDPFMRPSLKKLMKHPLFVISSEKSNPNFGEKIQILETEIEQIQMSNQR